ncbi:MAG: hypothetical protein E6230_09000 [Paenibacillus dendritiformis]|uniref:hypothetical protein n=1 Tax=uncultured Paenibacillus sp. TaxID=227322 RepID=UPI0025D4D263|nr:hypothetical protein [uncultured Paenibacillus sp.]MDU5142310.1 hypothetical protein [Paenibacillus dendritiformis]
MRWTKWVKWFAPLWMAALLLSAVPAHALAAEEWEWEEESVELNMEDIDDALLTRVQQEMKKLAGKEIELIHAYQSGEMIFLAGENEHDYASFLIEDIDNSLYVSAAVSYAEVPSKVKQAAEKALKALDGKKKFKFTDAVKAKEAAETGITYYINSDDASVAVANGAVTFAAIEYPAAQADKKALARAQEALKEMAKAAGVSAPKLTEAIRTRAVDGDVWMFSDGDGKASIVVGTKTGKIWSVSLIDNKPIDYDQMEIMANKMSNEKKIAAVSPVVKKIAGIDMKGYSVSWSPDYPNMFEYTKKGQPSIYGIMSSSGKVTAIQIQPVKGIAE